MTALGLDYTIDILDIIQTRTSKHRRVATKPAAWLHPIQLLKRRKSGDGMGKEMERRSEGRERE